jgi:hypothetical protein
MPRPKPRPATSDQRGSCREFLALAGCGRRDLDRPTAPADEIGVLPATAGWPPQSGVINGQRYDRGHGGTNESPFS